MAMKNNAKLTDELCCKLCEALAKGHSIEGACGTVGITRQTFYNWYDRGRKAKSGKYKRFLCEVDNAQDKATHLMESIVIDSAVDNPKDAKWWLTKRRPDTYGDRQYNETKIEADVKTEILSKLERPLPELDPD